MNKKLFDVLPTRRELLRLGGYGLLGSFADHAMFTPSVRAAGKTNVRGTARFVVVIELAGAIRMRPKVAMSM